MDEGTKLFTDKHGNEYTQMIDPYTLRTEIPYAYAKPIKVEDLKAEFPDMTLGEAISFHEYDSKGEVYLVGLLRDNCPFCVPIPLDRIRQQTQSAYEKIKNGRKRQYEKVSTKVDQHLAGTVDGSVCVSGNCRSVRMGK
jgi:hypothetical protein